MKNTLRNTALGGALALSISAPLLVQAPALAAPTSSSTVSKSSSNSLTASEVSSYSITHTKSGAKISGKISGVTSPQKVTLRIADAPFKTQIGNFEWEYTDSKGNFTINIEDLNDSNPRYWQLERGGGWNSYFSYSPVIASGKIVSGQTVKYPTPKPTPTVPTPNPTIPGNYTNGKGGTYSNREFVKYSAAGKSGQYHVYADGIDPKKPVGVVFHFHGDGAYEFRNPSYKLTKIRAAAKSKNMIVVSMKAPNSSNVWWNGIEGNGDYARSLISNEIYAKYNINKNKVWLLGYSGGSEFISYEMMEEQNDLFTG